MTPDEEARLAGLERFYEEVVDALHSLGVAAETIDSGAVLDFVQAVRAAARTLDDPTANG